MKEKKEQEEVVTKPIHYFITLIIMVILVLIAWNWLTGLFDISEVTNKDINSKDYKMEAYVMSQDFIKDYLKSPSTAKFPNYSKVNVVQTENRYKVEAYVESENVFGGIVKTNYYMILERDNKDEGWSKISCDIK